MQVYLVRHAQSENNRLYRLVGSSKGRKEDPELSELGQKQLPYVAEFLSQPLREVQEYGRDSQNRAGVGLTHLYSSLMVRAAATASAIGEACGLPVLGWKHIHEAGGMYLTDEETGEDVGMPGKGRAFLAERFSRMVLPDDVHEDGWWNEGREPSEAVFSRAQNVLDELWNRHGRTNDRVALVSHGEFIDNFIMAAVGIHASQALWFYMNNTAVTRIDFYEEDRAVMYMNRLDFLPRDLVS